MQGGLLNSNGPTRVVAPPASWNVHNRVLAVDLADVTWPGFSLVEPVPGWRAFEALAVEVFVPDGDPPLTLNVSIRLTGPVDHVYRTFVLPSGPHALRLQLRELFDPATCAVTEVVVYSTRESAGRRFYVARVALEA
jgi:hypothetical protein